MLLQTTMSFTTMLYISNPKPQFIVGTITPLPSLSNLDFRWSFTTIFTTPHRQHHRGFFPSYCRLQSPEKSFSTLCHFIIPNVTTNIPIVPIPICHQHLRLWHGCRVLEPIKEHYHVIYYDDFYQNLLYDLMFPSIQFTANPSSIQSLCRVTDL